MTPEKKVKDKVVAILKAYGAYYFYPVTSGYGASGVPDIVVATKRNFLLSNAKRVRTFQLHCKRGTCKKSGRAVALPSLSMRTTSKMLR